MQVTVSRQILAFGAAAILLPAALATAFFVLVNGGVIERLKRDERALCERRLEEIEDRAVAGVVAEAATAVEAGRIAITIDPDGRPTGPFAAVPGPLSQPAAETRDTLSALAEDALDRGDDETLILAMTRLQAASRPLSPALRLGLARALARLGRGAEAIDAFEKVAEDASAGIEDRLVAVLGAWKAAGGDPEARRRIAHLATGGRIPWTEAAARTLLERVAATGAADPDGEWARFDAALRLFGALMRKEASPCAVGRISLEAVPFARPKAALLVAVFPADVAREFDRAILALDDPSAPFDPVRTDRPGADPARAISPAIGSLAARPRGESLSVRAEIWSRRLIVLAVISFLSGMIGLAIVFGRQIAWAKKKTEFVDLVSHELRTPLAALSMRLEMLTKGDVPEAKRGAYLIAMASELDRLTAMTRRLLDFARLDRTRAATRFDPIDWRRITARVLASARTGLRARRQRVHVRVPRSAAADIGDPDLFERMLANLFENAVKYGRPGGRIEIALEDHGDRRRLVVADDGPGLDPRERRAVFQPFFRGKTAREGTVPGSGLGLAMVRHVAHLYGGEVRAEPRAGGGVQFIVEKPCPTRTH